MAIKTYKPVTPGRRGMTVTDSFCQRLSPREACLSHSRRTPAVTATVESL